MADQEFAYLTDLYFDLICAIVAFATTLQVLKINIFSISNVLFAGKKVLYNLRIMYSFGEWIFISHYRYIWYFCQWLLSS